MDVFTHATPTYQAAQRRRNRDRSSPIVTGAARPLPNPTEFDPRAIRVFRALPSLIVCSICVACIWWALS